MQKAQGFDYVIDATEGGSLIYPGGKDLMEDVKVELGFLKETSFLLKGTTKVNFGSFFIFKK